MLVPMAMKLLTYQSQGLARSIDLVGTEDTDVTGYLTHFIKERTPFRETRLRSLKVAT